MHQDEQSNKVEQGKLEEQNNVQPTISQQISRPLLAEVAPKIQIDVSKEKENQYLDWNILLKFLGPGLLISIAYMDPGNLESDLQVGCSSGYRLLWVVVVGTIAGYVLQLLSAKLGIATNKHLAQVTREEYPRSLTIVIWIMAELAIIGSDIQEIIGSAVAINVLSFGHINLAWGVIIGAVSSFGIMMLDMVGWQVIELVFALFVAVLSITFGIIFSSVGVSAKGVAKGLVIPYAEAKDAPFIAGIIGSLVMPYNIYLHSGVVLSREAHGFSNKRNQQIMLKYVSIESAISLFITLLVNIFAISVFAKSYYETPDEAKDIGLSSASSYLEEKYGTWITIVWGLGLLAAGQSATITGTYAGQYVFEAFLDLKITRFQRILFVRSISIAPTLLVALLQDSNQIDILNQSINILQALQLPFVLIPVVQFTSQLRIMRDMKNQISTIIVSLLISLLLMLINLVSAIQGLQSGFLVGFVTYPLLVVNFISLAYLVAVVFYQMFYKQKQNEVQIQQETQPLIQNQEE